MKKNFWLIACCITALDQMAKACIREMPLGVILYEIPGVFALTHSVNTGAAFSLFSRKTPLLTVVSAALLVFIYRYACRNMHLTTSAWFALACLMGGGAGNLIDRAFFSGVTDYIELQFMSFPIFNLADIAITGSIGVLLLLLLTNTLEKTSEEGHGSDH